MATTIYNCEDVTELFGPDFRMFGELMIGTPECEFCCRPAHYAWTLIPAFKTARDSVLFTCKECE